jgi:hypothetical protein
MQARWIDHDHIEVPATAQTGDVIGDGMITIDQNHQDFIAWEEWLSDQDQPRPER